MEWKYLLNNKEDIAQSKLEIIGIKNMDRTYSSSKQDYGIHEI